MIILLTVFLFFILFTTVHQSHHHSHQYNIQRPTNIKQTQKIKHDADIFSKRQLKETIVLGTSFDSTPQPQPEQLVSPPVAMETHGYIYLDTLSITPLSLGMSQLLTIQCWAEKLSLSVLEPTLMETHLQTPPPRTTPTLQISDVYNMDSWRWSQTDNPLSDVNEVDIRAVKQVLLVDIAPFHSYDTQSSNCLNNSTHLKAGLHLRYGLTVSHELCINSKERTIKETLDTIEDFLTFLKQQAQERTRSNKIAIIFRRWISSEWSTPPTLGDDSTHYCERIGSKIHRLRPSVTILRDVQRYYTLYEGNKSESMSVSIILTHDTPNKDKSICYERILTAFHNLKTTCNITHTFLTTLSSSYSPTKQRAYKTFFRSLFHNAYTSKKWRERLSFASTYSNIGYMSVLEQAISSYSTCLIIASQGQYSHVIRRWSLDNHSKQVKNNCLIKINACLTRE